MSWAGPMFKPTRTPTRVLRRRKTGRLKHRENKHKSFVRVRDHVCRFPLCPCGRFNLHLDVSHQEHKGMGGDPTGERSLPALMVLVCNWRHKEAKIAIDRGTLRWVPLTDQGANGPIAWEIEIGAFSGGTLARGWVELAREVEIGVLAPMLDAQRAILEHLGAQLVARFR